jgi:hypothetical protein
MQDDYQRPDFAAFKSLLEGEELVKKVPSNGNIRLRFYHFAGNCRIYDAAFLLQDGKVLASNPSIPDIDIWMHSDYVPKFTGGNMCDLTAEAKSTDNLGYLSNIGTVTLLWRYKGLVGYRDCFGI